MAALRKIGRAQYNKPGPGRGAARLVSLAAFANNAAIMVLLSAARTGVVRVFRLPASQSVAHPA